MWTRPSSSPRPRACRPGFMDSGTIGNLIGNDVSTTELNDRLTKGYEAAMNAPQETRTLLQRYYNVNTPETWPPTTWTRRRPNRCSKNQLVGAEVGTQAAQERIPETLTAKNATDLSANLAAQGKVGGATGTWNVDVGSTFATLAPLAQLEQQLPGMGCQAASTLTQAQLLNYGFLSKGQQNVQEVRLETRKAFLPEAARRGKM